MHYQGRKLLHKNPNVPFPPISPTSPSLHNLLSRYPVMWQGLLALKTDQAAVQMHYVYGSVDVARGSLPCNPDGTTPPLRIAQRMRLEAAQLDGVSKKLNVSFFSIYFSQEVNFDRIESLSKEKLLLFLLHSLF